MNVISSMSNHDTNTYIAMAMRVENSKTNLFSITYGSNIPLKGDSNGAVDVYRNFVNSAVGLAANSLKRNLNSNPVSAIENTISMRPVNQEEKYFINIRRDPYNLYI